MAKRRRQPGEYSPMPGTVSEYAPDEREFMEAVERHKSRTGRQFPTLKELLDILKELGWRKEARS